MSLNTVEELIEDIAAGKMVILMDDEDRENEGDLVIAASKVQADDINFMAKYGRGLICLTLTKDHCRRLNLPLMARNTYSTHSTNFTVSIEAAEGITTGISAADRATTVQAAVAEDAKPSDVTQPGHVFPLMAQTGGVLTRAGHTEAGCDLARLAGLQPSAVIVEILKDDGTMARRPDLEVFAKEHNIKIGTIADLIHYRIENEKTVECVAQSMIQSEYGECKLYAYQDSVQEDVHLALVKGEINPEEAIFVRVQLENSLADLTRNLLHFSSWSTKDVLQRIADEENAVVVILSHQQTPEEIVNQINNLNREKKIAPDNNKQQPDLRTFGLGAQILSDLGVRKMRVLSSPKKIHAISGFGLEVVEYID